MPPRSTKKAEKVAEMIEKVRAAELKGDKLQRYDSVLGRWIFTQKLLWHKLPVEERQTFLTLDSFRCMADMKTPDDVHQAEWNRMFALCRAFEAQHPETFIPFSQKIGDDPIGRWLKNARSDCVFRKRNATSSPTHFRKLKSLYSIRNWEKFCVIQGDELAQKAIDQMIAEGFSRLRPSPTPQTKTPYDILHVARNAPFEVVSAAYRALSLQHHPDKGGDHEEYCKIQRAYETLKLKHQSQ